MPKPVILKNSNGASLNVISLGGAITSLCLPDKQGHVQDIVLGFDKPEHYLNNPNYFGVLVGRYANRIAGGQFTLEGKAYQLATNLAPHHLHGGPAGFHIRSWALKKEAENRASLHYISADNEEGFPGQLDITVYYTLTDENELIIEYHATTDKTTLVNLTQHTYFNLAGHDSGHTLDHYVQINTDRYTPINAQHVPKGDIENVAGTPLDLRKSLRIKEVLEQHKQHSQLRHGGGFDHNYVVKDSFDKELKCIAEVYEPTVGRQMSVLTDQPGVQFYNGSFIPADTPGKEGAIYGPNQGLCLETQHFPDSPNHTHFPTTVLKPGQTYQTQTIYRFKNV